MLRRILNKLGYCHHLWLQTPELNRLYCCGEEGDFAWKCSRCGKVIYTQEKSKPVDHPQPTQKENEG